MFAYENIVENRENSMRGIDFPDGMCYNATNRDETKMLQRKQQMERRRDCAQKIKENGSLHGKSKP